MLQAPTDWFQGLRPWRGPGGQSPGLTSLPGFSGPETDMRSVLVHRFHGTDLLWPIPEGPPHAVVCRERKHDGWIGWQHLGG
jgi:hypothetical protein